MDEKRYKKKLEFQKKLIARQSEQIKTLELQVESLKLECKEKDIALNSIAFLRDELTKSVNEVKQHKEEYGKLIKELRKMKDIMNQSVYKGRWWIIRFLMK